MSSIHFIYLSCSKSKVNSKLLGSLQMVFSSVVHRSDWLNQPCHCSIKQSAWFCAVNVKAGGKAVHCMVHKNGTWSFFERLPCWFNPMEINEATWQLLMCKQYSRAISGQKVWASVIIGMSCPDMAFSFSSWLFISTPEPLGTWWLRPDSSLVIVLRPLNLKKTLSEDYK